MSTHLARRLLSAFAATTLAACATAPVGPSVLVLPGSRSSFDAFQLDDDACRGFAAQRSGALAATGDAGVKEAAVATAVGAAAGAAIGAATGDAAEGAAIGAGAGLLLGAAHGAESTAYAAGGLQRRYDNAYVQCMYAKGHQVPVPRSVANAQRWRDRDGDRPPPRDRDHAPPPGEPIEGWSPPPPPRGEPPPPPPDLE